MGLFRQKKEKVLDGGQERVANRIASAMLETQCRSAEWLNTRASKMGKRRLVILMAVLGLGFGLWCLYLVVGVLL